MRSKREAIESFLLNNKDVELTEAFTSLQLSTIASHIAEMEVPKAGLETPKKGLFFWRSLSFGLATALCIVLLFALSPSNWDSFASSQSHWVSFTEVDLNQLNSDSKIERKIGGVLCKKKAAVSAIAKVSGVGKVFLPTLENNHIYMNYKAFCINGLCPIKWKPSISKTYRSGKGKTIESTVFSAKTATWMLVADLYTCDPIDFRDSAAYKPSAVLLGNTIQK